LVRKNSMSFVSPNTMPTCRFYEAEEQERMKQGEKR
jgi:hypothetical protein